MAGDDPIPAEKPRPMIGSYRLVQSLGSGGMSSVFRAEHVETGVEVAVKILPRSLARNRTLLQRFLREAKSAEALEHPNIVAIYDHGVDNGQYYLVLEFIAGGDLHDWVRKHGPMPVAEAIAVMRGVAEGLKFAASQGLIHRDIKPANLLRAPNGTVKIADLGLALQAEAEDERVTREGTTVGTVDYMSPEQARDSRGTSERSDIYSLGCTLFFLLTGDPPFPGGDVTEKLSRHFTANPPDPASFRPDIPAALSGIVRKMMAKRPEQRFANYDDLIAALDAVPLDDPSSSLGATETLDALIVDDDEEDDSKAVPSYTRSGGAAPAAQPEPLYAVFDDDDDEEDDSPASDTFRPLDLSEDADDARPIADAPRMADVSMADLAAMVDDEARVVRAERSTVRRAPSASAVPAPARGPVRDEETEEVAVEGSMPGQVAIGSGRRMTAEERSWLKALVIGGVGLIVAVIAFHQLYRATVTEASPSIVESPPEDGVPAAPIAAVPEVVPPPFVRKAEPPLAVASVRKADGAAKHPKGAELHGPMVWIEPPDPPAPTAVDAGYAPEVETRFRPEWASAEVPSRVAGKFVSVRRLADPHDPDQKPSLSAALEVIGNGTVEIADDGPFFENDLRLSGEVRLVRARPGYRPVICLDAPRLEVSQQRAAFFDIEGRSLILDGLDLIVDAKDLPRGFEAIFVCRGGTLTLRDCTITVLNRGGLPVSVVQTAPGEKPSRVRFERTLVRGSFTSLVDLAGSGAEVFLSRSVIVNGHGSVISSNGSGTADRRVTLARSVVATRGATIEVVEPPAGARPRPLTLRALGTTFAHLAAPVPTSLIAWKGDGTVLHEMVSWQGEANTYAGWSDWVSAGRVRTVRVPNLFAARGVWAGTDSASLETPDVRPLPVAADRAGPVALRGLAPERGDVLARVPVATPLIHEKTLESFPRPIVPGLTDANGVSRPTPPVVPPKATTLTSPGIRDLTFDAEVAPWSGDLGRFLASSVRPGDTLVRVRVSGTGPHVSSPVKLPEGVALEVVVTPGPGGRSPSWSAPKASAGDALIDVRSASLVLVGVNLSRDASAGLKRLVRVDGGHLVLHRCRLIARGPLVAGGGGLIEFNAPGSKPLTATTPAAIPWPFETVIDRPTCRLTESVLITSGEVVSATVGRGVVALSQCAVVAGTSAFSLRPGKVARQRFAADLWLDRCTVASERAFVALGAWPGADPGPDRPWLVSTRRCAFFGTYDRRTQESVLLRADADSFAHGALFWQGSGDAFEVPHFRVSGDAPPPANIRPDVTRQWADLWGHTHVHAASGPHPPTGTMSRRLVNRLLKPGDVAAGDLFIDPSYPKDEPPGDLGADLARLGIKPTPRTARPR